MRFRAPYKVTCYLHATQDLYHLSKVHCGLFELVHRGHVNLRLTSRKPVAQLRSDPPWTPWLEITDTASAERRIVVIDLSDHSDFYYTEALERTDVYFKRNLNRRRLSSIPESNRSKILPLGLNYGCRSSASTRGILRRFLVRASADGIRTPSNALDAMRRTIANVRQFIGTLDAREYEQLPSASLDPVIMFQTRVWAPGELPPAVDEQINRPRAELVRRLKSEFGSGFRGGLVRDDYSKKYFADALTDLPSHRTLYIASSKKSLIGIYTRGLHDSLAFKLPEYLAASKCIVAEPLDNELPADLIPGAHFLEFNTADECVEQCSRLLEDSELAARMRRRNWDYYATEVAPEVHMANLLERAFGRKPKLDERATY